MIFKMTDVSTNINVGTAENGFIGANFYTEDDGSAYIRITIKDNNEVLDFNKTDMTPRLDLFSSDGSIFTNEPLEVVLPEHGVIQYKVSDNVIKHAGRMDAKLFLANKKDSIHVANFYFTITDSGMTGPIGKEISVELLEKYVANVMSKNAMGLLSDDYRKRLETEIKKYIIDNNKAFNLKFEDLTRSEKDELMKNLTNEGLADFRIEDNSILGNKLVDGTVTPDKTSFIDKSNNLLNKNDVIANKNLDATTGELTNSTVTNVFNTWLPVKKGEVYTSASINRKAYYRADKTFLSAITGNGTFTVPDDAVYMRISAPKENNAQLNRGSKLLAYDEYREQSLSPEVKINNLPDNSVTTSTIKNKAVTPDKLSFVEESKNLIDKNKLVDGYSIPHGSNGEPVANSSNAVTDFIKILSESTYTTSTGKEHRITFYDKNKKYITQYYNADGEVYTFTTPSNAQYLRMNVHTTRRNDPILNKGEVLLPYEDWHEPMITGIAIDNTNVKNSTNVRDNTNLSVTKNSIYTVDHSLNVNYKPEKVPGCSNNDPLPMSKITYTDMYAMYDELCKKYPNYVSKNVEGKNDFGKELITYKFSPESPDFTQNLNDTERPFKRFKFFITTSTHGNERMSIWSMYQLMRLVCEEWQNDEALEFLRWNVDIVVLPIHNPSGYENFTRVNGNNIDLNRNYDANWSNGTSDPNSTSYRGPKAMSEAETWICDGIFKRENPDFFIDFHNFHSQSKPHYFNWIVGYTEKVNQIADLVIAKNSRKWKQQYPDLPQDVNGFGYGSPAIDAGTISNYALKKYGIPSSLFEVCWKLDAKPGVVNRDSFISTLAVDCISNFLLQIAINANEL